MSDESEIACLQALLQRAVMTAYHKQLVPHAMQYPGETKFYAVLGAPFDQPSVDGRGATELEALRDIRDKLRAELVRRRDEHNAAIAMLGSE